MNISYGHFSGLCTDMVEWCRSRTAKDELDHAALCALENYTVMDYSISSEQAKRLYLMMTKETDDWYETLFCYMHNTYTTENFDYIPFTFSAEYGVEKREWTYSTTTVSDVRKLGLYMDYVKGRRKSDDWEARDAWISMVDFIEGHHDTALTYDFSPEENGLEDAWVHRFIELVGRSAITGEPISFY